MLISFLAAMHFVVPLSNAKRWNIAVPYTRWWRSLLEKVTHVQPGKHPEGFGMKVLGISLPPYCTSYTQSFNFRSFVVPWIPLDKKSVINNHPPTPSPNQLIWHRKASAGLRNSLLQFPGECAKNLVACCFSHDVEVHNVVINQSVKFYFRLWAKK